MLSDISEVSYTAEEIQACVERLATQLKAEYGGKNPVFVCILKGSFVFLADLVRACDFPLEVQFMRASSYKAAAVTSGSVSVFEVEELDITGRHTVIIEDILDSGFTLLHIRELLMLLEPASLRICTLLDKSAGRKVDIEADFTGFSCPPGFLVGYGLDYGENYRNLPYIGVLKSEIYDT